MNYKIVAVNEARALAANGQIVKVIVVTYNVGPLGPFTLETTQAELALGTAQQKMQAFANTLGTLPGSPAA